MSVTQWVNKYVSDAGDALSSNIMREDLIKRAHETSLTYDVYVQFDTGTTATPIEDTFTEWTERAAPPVRVAQLVLDQQDFNNTEQNALCETMAFTPGRFHPEHRPLSNMGRGRIFSYQASAMGRGATFTDPSPEIVSHLREINAVKL
jgi:hypothetical protein